MPRRDASAGCTTRGSIARSGSATSRAAACRTWLDPTRARGRSRAGARIVAATVDARLLVARRARRARCATDFGDSGTVDLRVGLRNAPLEIARLRGDVAARRRERRDRRRLGDRRQQPHRRRERRGARVRRAHRRAAVDVGSRAAGLDRSRLRDVARAARARTGAANAWSVLAADPARDLVFVPTGSASPDYYGGERLGDNRYANSIVALRASTGKVVWPFQTVHHDLWDYDNASPPALVTVRVRRPRARRRAAGDEDRAAVRARPRDRRADLAGRGAARAALDDPRRGGVADAARERDRSAARRSGSRADSVWGATDADRARVPRAIAALRNDGPFTPPSFEGSLAAAVEHRRRALGRRRVRSVDADRRRADEHHRRGRAAHPARATRFARAGGTGNRIGGEFAPHARHAVRRCTASCSSCRASTPCTPPPFGALVGVDLRRGAIALARAARRPMPCPVGRARRAQPRRRDHDRGRADVHRRDDRPPPSARSRRETGRELWRDAAGGGQGDADDVPRRGGRQYVVISAGGDDGGAFGDERRDRGVRAAGDEVRAMAQTAGDSSRT